MSSPSVCSVKHSLMIGKPGSLFRANTDFTASLFPCFIGCKERSALNKAAFCSSNGFGFRLKRFVEWAQNEIAVVPDFHKRILFSDEEHFWLNGYVNKQNCRIWSEANPQVYAETPIHPEKLTVWCALWAGGIIGPNFFKNDEGHNITVNGDRYRAMITNFSFLN
ncbi:uncharacterized protein TNCV_1308091 [Trichonephila clavipes]|nr:uncharacterized protein TNCV_1308091 [Trichonephila clavipes]